MNEDKINYKSDLVATSGHWQMESDPDAQLPDPVDSRRTPVIYQNCECWAVAGQPGNLGNCTCSNIEV